MTRNNLFVVRLDPLERHVIKVLAAAYTDGNEGKFIRSLVRSAGQTLNILTAKDVLHLKNTESKDENFLIKLPPSLGGSNVANHYKKGK
jgi:hypothetical protein